MAGTFTPMQMNAGAGLLQDQGLTSGGSSLAAAISAYTAIPAIGNITLAQDQAHTYLSNGNLLESVGDGVFPALVNSIPAADISTFTVLDSNGDEVTAVSEGSLTTRITGQAGRILGADYGVFSIHFACASAFTSQSNQFITSALNIENSQGVSNDINNLLTGAVTDTTLALSTFAEDLLNTGDLIDYNQLTNLGNPLAFVKRYWNLAGGLPILDKYLNANGINSAGLVDAVNRSDPSSIINMQVSDLGTAGLVSYPEGLEAGAEAEVTTVNIGKKGLGRAIWDVLGQIKDEDLQELQNIISSSIPGLESAQDLLDPKKILPKTYQSLKSFDDQGQRGFIYTNDTLNQSFNGLGTNLYTAVPEYIADSNQALSRSLQQIKDVFNVTSQSLSQLTEKLETTKGLDIINALESPVPASTISFFKTLYGQGSGPNGEFLVTDVIGSVAGYTHTVELEQMTTTISNLDDLNELDYLNELYYAITQIYANASGYYYTVPGPPDPETGTPTTIPMWEFPSSMSGPLGGTNGYSSRDAAVTAAIGEIDNELSRLASAYPTQAELTTNNITNMSNQVKRELSNMPKAGIVPEETQLNVKSSVMGLVSNLHDYGADDSLGGAGWILENCADQTTLYGEAIVAALREGRNIRRMNDAGVGNALTIESDTRTAQKATFTDSKFTVDEAKDNLDL